MEAVFSFIATWALAALGFMLLAISQKQHRGLLLPASSGLQMSWLRGAGWALLGISLVPAVWRDGLAFGLLAWSMILTLSAFFAAGVICALKLKFER